MPAKPLSAIAMLLLFAAPVAAQRGWTGSYAYEEPLGRDAGGQGPVVARTHRLTIAPGQCRLRATGYQTDTTIICRARAIGANGLEISFVSHGDGRIVNQFGVAQYRRRQPLLSLSRDRGRLLTSWQAYGLDDPRTRRGVFLRRL